MQGHILLVLFIIDFLQEGIVENVGNDLKSILKSGKYHYIFPSNVEEQCRLVLKFSKCRKQSDKMIEFEWDNEQVRDFVQKLDSKMCPSLLRGTVKSQKNGNGQLYLYVPTHVCVHA